MEDYELKEQKNTKRNEKFINEFEVWLRNSGVTDKTINKHIANIDLYLNDYLNYYDIYKMEEGVSRVYGFLNDWFIRKCLWSSVSSIKTTAASIKKFYKCMCELNHIKEDEYNDLCRTLKDNMDDFIDSYNEFMSDDEYDEYY